MLLTTTSNKHKLPYNIICRSSWISDRFDARQESRHSKSLRRLLGRYRGKLPPKLSSLRVANSIFLTDVIFCQMCDKDWAARIKVEKFRSHNQQWLEMVESIAVDNTNHLVVDEDDSLPPFMSGELLRHTMLFPSGKLKHDRL